MKKSNKRTEGNKKINTSLSIGEWIPIILTILIAIAFIFIMAKSNLFGNATTSENPFIPFIENRPIASVVIVLAICIALGTYVGVNLMTWHRNGKECEKISDQPKEGNNDLETYSFKLNSDAGTYKKLHTEEEIEAWSYDTDTYKGISVGIHDSRTNICKTLVSIESASNQKGIEKRIIIDEEETSKYGFNVIINKKLEEK